MRVRLVRQVLMFGLVAGLGPGLAAPTLAGSALRVLIVSSDVNPDGGVTTPILKRILTETGRFDVRVCESPAGLGAAALNGFDLLVDNGAGLAAGSEGETAIARFVESGKGLVITQGALGRSNAPGFWPAIAREAPTEPIAFRDVTISRTDHPITTGLNAAFRMPDALPGHLSARAESTTLATCIDARGNGREVPVLVASRFGAGRVAAIALGHDASAMHEPRFRTLFARTSEWAGTGAVTLPVELPRVRPAPGAVRGLVITGGHDHEAAFYSLFDGYDDLDWLPVETSQTAFKKDLRGQYDVLILYDFTRDLDEAGKTNLRAFAESGKGIVVLHHALLDFQTWTWWSDEVVGGRYRLQREGESPSSSVKNDQEIFATPAGPHPVLEGIAPFHITDEAYKNLAMSPRIRPLLTTDNPTSDRNLAWVGPCQTSRVVAIQLGHGHSAFGHPSYRALVHNAVLWAARKTHDRSSP